MSQHIVVTDYAAAEDFSEIGYEYLGEFGIAGRRYLRKGGEERTHQIHIFQADDWNNMGHGIKCILPQGRCSMKGRFPLNETPSGYAFMSRKLDNYNEGRSAQWPTAN